MPNNWRNESEAVLHSPTKRELQARESAHRTGSLSRGHKCSTALKIGVVVVVVLVVILIAVLVPVVVTQAALKRPPFTAYCDGLPDRPQMLCRGYMAAQGPSKAAAAAGWRYASPTTCEQQQLVGVVKAEHVTTIGLGIPAPSIAAAIALYACVTPIFVAGLALQAVNALMGHMSSFAFAAVACAGIEGSCVNADLQSSKPGTACQPLATGAQCGDQQQTCQAGFCGGPAAEASKVVAASFKAPDAPSANANASSALSEITLYRMPAVPAAPNASWPTAIASVWPNNVGIRVPETFLATSHEWKGIQDYGGVNIQAWAEIFGMLSDSPLLRIGGASQDAMIEAPGPDVWNALVQFQKASKCRYIIGLPLWQKNAVELSQQIMKNATDHLGDSLLGFELGNEPEFWPTGLGGYDENGTWVSGFEAFAGYFQRVAMSLNPCSKGSGTNKRLLSGPGWGNVNTQDPSWFAKIVDQGAGCYFWESNTHYYPYVNNETVTSQELLTQSLQDFALDKFKAYAQISKSYGLNIRVSETNSMYGGGRKGLSETMAGTLWTTDALFAFANAGARAFHLHWGANGDAPPSVGVQTNYDSKVPEGQPPLPWPSVHAPWFGYMMWTIAAAGGYGRPVDTKFVAANVDEWGNCTANIKVWALRSDADDVRIALINKDHEKSCNIKIHLDLKFCSNAATLSRLLPGQLGMESKAGITWQGQHYIGATTTGKLQGMQEVDAVVAELQPGSFNTCSYTVALPKTSAALLTVTPEKPAI